MLVDKEERLNSIQYPYSCKWGSTVKDCIGTWPTIGMTFSGIFTCLILPPPHLQQVPALYEFVFYLLLENVSKYCLFLLAIIFIWHEQHLLHFILFMHWVNSGWCIHVNTPPSTFFFLTLFILSFLPSSLPSSFSSVYLSYLSLYFLFFALSLTFFAFISFSLFLLT